jgi:hypothetical protein
MIEITYDRTEKLYKWIDPHSGEVLTAPARQKGSLFRAAVCILDPDLYAAAEKVIEKYPQLERVTWRAVELVAKDAIEVYPAQRGGVAAMVDSSDEFGRYAIEATAHGLTCQCEHFQGMHAPLTESGSRYCKHIIAYHLWLHTRAEW